MTIVLPVALPSVLFWIGVALVLFALWPNQHWQSAVLIVGLVLAGTGRGMQSDSAPPLPGPTPPGPSPVIPVGEFAERLRAAFTGTKAERQIIGALHTQFAESLAFDGRREKPAVTNTTQMGQAFADLTRYRSGAESPWGQRFAPLEQTITQEAVSRGVIVVGKSQPMDATRRNAAVQFFREVGAALSAE